MKPCLINQFQEVCSPNSEKLVILQGRAKRNFPFLAMWNVFIYLYIHISMGNPYIHIPLPQIPPTPPPQRPHPCPPTVGVGGLGVFETKVYGYMECALICGYTDI